MVDGVVFNYRLVFLYDLLLAVGDRSEKEQGGLDSSPDDADIFKEHIY